MNKVMYVISIYVMLNVHNFPEIFNTYMYSRFVKCIAVFGSM